MNVFARLILFITLFIVIIVVWKNWASITREHNEPQHNTQVAGTLNDTSRLVSHPRMNKIYDSIKLQILHPFVLYQDGSFLIAAEIESNGLLTEFQPVFDEFGLSGNGYSWEGVIRQILQKHRSSLLSHINFDPEAGGFYAYADSPDSQLEFGKLMSEIFSNHTRLKEYLQKIDTSTIID